MAPIAFYIFYHLSLKLIHKKPISFALTSNKCKLRLLLEVMTMLDIVFTVCLLIGNSCDKEETITIQTDMSSDNIMQCLNVAQSEIAKELEGRLKYSGQPYRINKYGCIRHGKSGQDI